MNLAEHPQASRLAQPHNLHAAGRPSVFSTAYATTPEIRSFIRTADFPDRLEGWLCSDSPQLRVKIVVFQDATLVTISFPHSLMDMAIDELTLNHAGDSSRLPFISEGDVLFVWWTKVVLQAESPSPSCTINMRNTYCCRSVLAELGHIPSATSVLVTNAVFAALTFLSVRQVLAEPLSFTASEVRKSFIQQRTPEQLQVLDAIQRNTLDNAHHPALFGDPNMYIIMILNWVKAKLFQVDFSAAVQREGMSLNKRSNQLGRPSCIQGTGTRDYATRNTGVVIGKDAAGNWWLLYTLRKQNWPAVEEQILSMVEDT
ncbi:hypothetical protein H112_08945 [Trichophyton rubrum D6]|uniref:Uncharacterized protein n=2 Tax=Trichophyton TaxID=5550 RepID=A0A022VN49_TRIRU|nr:hypothetical protein H100_08968 [Trichophyton rubrum MR850]EZF36582.1 hypothetical protein H102_08926 [Trichophyton rubrum CBS 100081]EZF47163.1 hypothetical protein H103_08949 [Trichophyton rubrum CBS 288.86]EZF57845.1 hypothetical protein H104_08897 [Trichophyton rubrum CBS 289.86]EZF68433.1 hypothetical protein H105_08954 [Trichophyton soudanense CBS 452.61]EZF79135.1 hypothetical protein H110_08949 [Trichophyton rubrum MR1448]EZG11332.1 hypothetical protein H107_09106 [Trichophyton rub